MSLTEKLHIGFITMEYPHSSTGNSGGLGTSIKHLTRALSDEGYKVSVFIVNQDENAEIDDSGITLYKIKHKTFRAFNWLLYRIYANKRINLICKNKGVDILEAPDWTGLTAFMKFKIPVVIRFHGSDTYFCHLEKRPQKWKNRFLESNALKMADAYIAPTEFAATETQKLFKINKKEIRTIHYGLSLNDFINNNPSSFTPNTILYIGTIIRKKGVLDLAQIFNLVVEANPEVKLILVGADSGDVQTGTNSTYSLFEALLTPKALSNVSYLGKVPYTEVKNCIKNAQVCVFPSFAETLGMVTIESMAMQKAVVNTSIGWAQSLIDNGENGYLIHPTHHKEYAERINSLLNDIPKCISIGKAARLKVDSAFNMKIQVKKNIQFYKELIGL
ncbi:glycosyltransferase family 4 protein [Winogradskyella litoriviva]|uniref:Glycosyltransferase family 4 protein n=1 Tax=Winogradskyella litoriviva TaxID=1220182 RepID=A0ABX2E4C2_9FLAO|nr:glycosyltransferase family 4 protein [Winogradskyella litoriviva]NRD22821.1 glycosyltransferase family 4 protein [Winogradskyella litoriviva]